MDEIPELYRWFYESSAEVDELADVPGWQRNTTPTTGPCRAASAGASRSPPSATSLLVLVAYPVVFSLLAIRCFRWE